MISMVVSILVDLSRRCITINIILKVVRVVDVVVVCLVALVVIWEISRQNFVVLNVFRKMLFSATIARLVGRSITEPIIVHTKGILPSSRQQTKALC